MEKAKLWAMVLMFSLALVVPGACASSEKAPRQDKETLKSWLSDPEVVVIDVRSSGDWEKATTKIKGAMRHDPKEVKAWAATVPKDKKIILYCAWKGEGTSARVAQELIGMGFEQVWALKGGWVEWEKAGYPTEPKWYLLRSVISKPEGQILITDHNLPPISHPDGNEIAALVLFYQLAENLYLFGPEPLFWDEGFVGLDPIPSHLISPRPEILPSIDSSFR